jgi:hypothetical protein
MVRAVTSLVLDVLAARRDVKQLETMARRPVLDKLSSRLAMQHAASAQSGRSSAPWCTEAKLGRTLLQEAHPGILEAVVLCHWPLVTRACALRFERAGRHVILTNLEIA